MRVAVRTKFYAGVQCEHCWVEYWGHQRTVPASVFDLIEKEIRLVHAQMGPLPSLSYASLDEREFPPDLRERVNQFLVDTRPLRNVGGTVLVTDSMSGGLLRTLLSTMLALTRGNQDKIFKTTESAIDWLVQCKHSPYPVLNW